MNRQEFFKVAGFGGASCLGFSGCESLDTSAAAEGTGIQFVGLVRVLAKYEANPRQRQVAETRASTAYVKQALQPAYEKRKATLETTHQAKVRQVQRTQARQISQAKRVSETEVAKVETEQEQLLEELEEDARERLLALNASWHQQAAEITDGRFSTNVELPTRGEVAQSSVREEARALLADASSFVPQYLAVSVPQAGNPAEAKAADSVMFWDTQQRDLAKDEVYVMARTPGNGQNGNFGDITAKYVGRVQ